MSRSLGRWVGVGLVALGCVGCGATATAPATPGTSMSPSVASPTTRPTRTATEPSVSPSTRATSSASPASGPLVEGARWVTRGGRASLEVTPAAALREGPDDAAVAAAWERVLAPSPRARRPGMRDQFVCHVRFAPTKTHFYLEPWRPAVGYLRTVAEACNPGERKELG